jgi:myo-inositol-1(or 4)-monophosphatase
MVCILVSLPVIEIALRNGSTCVVALAMVAEESVDAYYEVHVQPWDCLAGILIVREAGGRPPYCLLADQGTGDHPAASSHVLVSF